MSDLLPERGRLTDALVDHLDDHELFTSAGIVFGDQVAPPSAGYAKGAEPGDTGGFVASVVLTTSVAVPIESAPDPISSSHYAWKMTYGLRITGGSRSQTDFAGDRGRKAVVSFPIGDVDLGAAWKVQRLLFTRLAAMREVKSLDVPQFVLDDVIEVWVVRERARGAG